MLLFSQFTVLLDIMEPFLRSCGHTYLRLDGRTPAAQRSEVMKDLPGVYDYDWFSVQAESHRPVQLL